MQLSLFCKKLPLVGQLPRYPYGCTELWRRLRKTRRQATSGNCYVRSGGGLPRNKRNISARSNGRALATVDRLTDPIPRKEREGLPRRGCGDGPLDVSSNRRCRGFFACITSEVISSLETDPRDCCFATASHFHLGVTCELDGPRSAMDLPDWVQLVPLVAYLSLDAFLWRRARSGGIQCNAQFGRNMRVLGELAFLFTWYYMVRSQGAKIQ